MGAQYADQMFNWTTASTSLTTMNSGVTATAGPYFAQQDGTLLAIDVILTPQAASSLCQQGRIEISNPNWNPNLLRYGFAGFGLATAPQLYGGQQAINRFAVNQPVKTQWPLLGQAIFFFSPVTPNLVVMGYFG